MKYAKNIIQDSATIKEALQQLNLLPKTLTLFIINSEQILIGTLTDGDIRRAMLSNLTMQDPLMSFMNRSFKFIEQGKYDNKKIKDYKALGIKLIPILDERGAILNIVNLQNKKAILPLDAVIMAGGEGSRLRPLTLDTPKPLLKVADKPIVEYNIDRLDLFGIKNITFSIKYLGHKIKEYFGDGSNRYLQIDYVEEEKALGTIGAVKLVPNFYHDFILVMNSDVLTNIDLESMFLQLISSNADMIVASKPYDVKIPYGVIETVEDEITGLVEKPTYTYYSNAGIYIIRKSCLDFIPQNTFFNATDLIQSLMDNYKKVLNYPLQGYWLDIGKPADYEQAQIDVHQIVF